MAGFRRPGSAVLPSAPEATRVEALAGDDKVTIYSRSGIITVPAAELSDLVGKLVCAGAMMSDGRGYPGAAAKKVVH